MRKQRQKIKDESQARQYRRKLRIRKKVIGTAQRPRLCFIRSNKNFSLQVIDDAVGHTVYSCNTFGKNGVKVDVNNEGIKNFAQKVGTDLKAKGILQVVFDRNGVSFKGLLKTFTDSLRVQGLSV